MKASTKISPYSFFFADKVILTLSPGNFIETEQDALIMQCLADQIPPFWWDVVVTLSENLSYR
jgi:hypothetical protein